MRTIVIILAVVLILIGISQFFNGISAYSSIQSGAISIVLAVMLIMSGWGKEYEGVVNIPNGEIIKPRARYPHPDPVKSNYEVFCFSWGKKSYVDEIQKTSPVLEIGVEYEKVTDGFRRVNSTEEVLIFS